jgi:hypothetical protein
VIQLVGNLPRGKASDVIRLENCWQYLLRAAELPSRATDWNGGNSAIRNPQSEISSYV